MTLRASVSSVRSSSYELVTIWNGSHRGADGDLLCCPRLPEKRHGGPVSVDPPKDQGAWDKSGLSQQAIIHALGTGPLTARDLTDVTGLGYSAVLNAIQRLRAKGIVGTLSAEHRKWFGRPEALYGLIDEEAA